MNGLERLLRTLAPPAEQILSLRPEAAAEETSEPNRSQFSLLVRHFLERFFNHEAASPDGDAKTRLVQAACAAGVPGFAVALYMWHPYHPMVGPLPSYWVQVSDHFFYVIYSFVAMGIVTVFEWDLFFPDLLDVFVLSNLPIAEGRLFRARIAAISILVLGFLVDANFLAPLALPAAIDPPDILRFMSGHLLSAGMSGLFAAALVLALQGMLIGLLGERLFRRVSLFLQGLIIAALLMLLFLFPVLSGVIGALMRSDSGYAFYFPPFWFLGIYQRLMEGPSALPIYTSLAQTGCAATTMTIAAAILFYPLAYWRRTRQLVEGTGSHDTRSWIATPVDRALHASFLRLPVRRAIYHFTGQTIFRVQRYRIYLVMYGGLMLSLIGAAVLRLTVEHGHIRAAISAGGLRAAIPMIAFWTIAGFRMTFVSPGNRRGNWIFQVVHGQPGRDPLQAAKTWVLLWATVITLGAYAALRTIAPAELQGWRTAASQALVAAGLCLLLTDAFFLNVRIIPFTGVQPAVHSNLAAALLKYFAWLPPVIVLPPLLEPWIEASGLHMALTVLLIAWAHLRLEAIHGRIVRERAALQSIDDEAEEFPLRLGLRSY